ncbi:MAG: hypothetical protein LQ340_001906 [Diploschistes diacapsis]|nr:MAG: hypothetical protein LQ340_001906 [Diploschistes diacapsis]
MQFLLFALACTLLLVKAIPHRRHVLLHQHHPRNPLAVAREAPFPLPNGSLPNPTPTGTLVVPILPTGTGPESFSTVLITKPMPPFPLFPGYSPSPQLFPSSQLTNIPGTALSALATSVPALLTPIYTVVPTASTTGTGYSLLLPPLPTATFSPAPAPAPSQQALYCNLGSITCNGRHEYSICAPGPGKSHRPYSSSSTPPSQDGDGTYGSDSGSGSGVPRRANAPLKRSGADTPASLAGDHLRRMGRVPHGTECVDDAVDGFTGDDCAADGDIMCQGGEAAWSVCVGGYWADMGNLPGEDVCVHGTLMGPI